MLDDFGTGGSKGASTGRFGASLLASVVLYGSIGAGVVTASAIARRAVVEDDLLQVELAPPPPEPIVEPPPPPPPAIEEPPPAAPPRLGRPRPQLEQPEEIPEERPDESDAALTPPGDPFAPEGEGDPNGTPDGQLGARPVEVAVAPPPPAPEPARPRGPVRVIEGSTPPSVDREEIARNFVIPAEVRSAGVARITMVVRVTIDASGAVTNVAVLRGHPLIPNDNIVRAVERSHFQPARLPDGTAYAAIHTLPITIAVTL